MSTIAMSGLYERTFKSRSSAVPACPTISNPLPSSRLATPSRRSTESSASTTRIRAGSPRCRSGCSSSTLRVSPKERLRDKVEVGSASPREQCLDRRSRQFSFRNEAERWAARDERPEISAIETGHEDHPGRQLEPAKLFGDFESVGIG